MLQSLSVAPDPISIPGSLRVSAAVSGKKTMASPLKVRAGAVSVGQGRAKLPRTTSPWAIPHSGYGYEQLLEERGTKRYRAECTGLCQPGQSDGHGETRRKLPTLSWWEKHHELGHVLGT